MPERDISYEFLPLHILEAEPEAQRTTDNKRAQRIADTWEPAMLGSLIVAAVGDRRVVVDGMHRVEGARIRGDVKELHAQIVHGLTLQERARLFLRLQAERRNVAPEVYYRVALTAGEPREVGIDLVLEARGLRVGGTPTTNTIAAVRAMQHLYDFGERNGVDGSVAVALTIDMLASTWGTIEGGDRWAGDLIAGVGRLCVLNPEVSRHRLVQTLAKDKPRGWIATATSNARGSSGSGGRPIYVAAAVAGAYNRGIRRPGHLRWTA